VEIDWEEWVWLEVVARIYMLHTTVASHSPGGIQRKMIEAKGIHQKVSHQKTSHQKISIRKFPSESFHHRISHSICQNLRIDDL